MSKGRDPVFEANVSADAAAWIAPGVQAMGRVSLAAGVSLWPYCVIRAEAHSVSVGRMSNVQDFCMLHVGYEHGVAIGEFCSIAHRATVHGATVEDFCLIGIGATLMDGAVIGRGSIVAGGALVPEGKVFPPGSVIAGLPARIVAERDCARENRLNAWHYHRNAEYYARGEHRAWDGPGYRTWLEEMRARIAGDRDLV